MKEKIIKIMTTALISFLLISCEQKLDHKENAESTPNVIVILTDQWRMQATGYSGNDQVKTPNLDKLAAESVNMTTSIVSVPVCSPARASIITGQYPLTHGVFYNDKPLNSEAITIAEVYKENGYKTGYIGKWHINGHAEGENKSEHRKKPVEESRRQGFDYWKVHECNHEYNNSIYFDENNGKQIWNGYEPEQQTDSAIAFINKNKKNKFLLFLSWGPPHAPYLTAPKKYRDIYSNLGGVKLRPNVPDSLSDIARKETAGYYAHIAALDEYLGILQNEVKELRLEENTIFVFTSDHGDMLYSHGKVKKQQPWDESILVPFLIKYPAKITKPREIKTPFVTVDIMPSLLGLSNLPIPKTVEGTDYSKYFTDDVKIDITSGLIMCPVPFHQWSRKKGGREYRGVRTERFTYVKDLNGPWLLYDNFDDPYQLINEIDNPEFSQIKTDLERELDKLLAKTNDDFEDGDYYMNKWNYAYD